MIKIRISNVDTRVTYSPPFCILSIVFKRFPESTISINALIFFIPPPISIWSSCSMQLYRLRQSPWKEETSIKWRRNLNRNVIIIFWLKIVCIYISCFHRNVDNTVVQDRAVSLLSIRPCNVSIGYNCFAINGFDCACVPRMEWNLVLHRLSRGITRLLKIIKILSRLI